MLEQLKQDLCGNTQFRVRRSPDVKREFFGYVGAFLNERGWQGRPDGDFKQVTNLIFGDERKAKVLITAHYDTPKTGYTAPNFYVTNDRGYAADWVIGAGILTAVFGGATAAYKTAKHFKQNGWPYAAGWLGLMAAYTAASFTIDNKFNFNDNTSGCIALLGIADWVAKNRPELRDQIAIVFFDQEESGLRGSKKFNKALLSSLAPEVLSQKLLLNFDCVGGRDSLFRLYTNTPEGLAIARKVRAHSDRADFLTYQTNHFPSDSSSFKAFPALSFISVKNSPLPGLEKLSDTHSKRDNFLDTAMVREYIDLTAAFLGEYL
ncbi:MAG: M28 family peptidase [Oscillospiraceae bacterium]|jgi:hypothetical protein|nr:M28 family peptidase [Oscillospiraceae bacterium]